MATLTLVCGQGNNECAFVEKSNSNYTKQDPCVGNLYAGTQGGGTGGATTSSRSWLYFDISGLPANPDVTKVEIIYKVVTAGGAAGEWYWWPYDGPNPDQYPCDHIPLTCYSKCAYGTPEQYLTTTDPRSTGTYTQDLGSEACSDVEACRASNSKYAISISEVGDNDLWCIIAGCQAETEYAPRLVITYSVAVGQPYISRVQRVTGMKTWGVNL